MQDRLAFGDEATPLSTPSPSCDPRIALRAAQCARHLPTHDWHPEPPPDLHGERRIILNAETTGLQWWSDDRPIGWSWRLPESGRTGYLPIRHRGVGNNLDLHRVRDWLRSLAGCHIDNINTKFDLHMAREDGVDLTELGCTFGDVAHQAALLDDNRMRFNLDQLCADELGWRVEDSPLGKLPPMITHEGEFQSLHPGIVEPYARRNVEQVDRLEQAFRPRILEEGLSAVLKLEQDIIPVVVEMERQGTYLDIETLHAWHARATADLEGALWSIYRASGVMLDSPDSSKGLATLFKVRGIPIGTLTATGQPSFTSGVLRAIDDPCIRLVEKAGQLADLKSKYLDKYAAAVRSDGWLRFNLHQLRSTRGENDSVGAVSGRFSAAGDKFGGYNPQQVVAVEKQLERGWCPEYVIRKLFRPQRGVCVAADMMQVEYRLFAHYANDPAINAAYAANPLADFHQVVLELLQRVNPYLTRKLAKNINFAKIYGAGLLKFAFMIGEITEADYERLAARLSRKDWSALDDPALAKSRALNDAYNTQFPAIKPLLDRAARVAEHRGYVKTILGRRARLTGRYHSSINRVVQGGAADINKRTLVEVYRQRHALGLTMRLTVHDELVGDLEDPAMLPRLEAILNTQYIPVQVLILWDAKTGQTWADCK
jgi:DNA polymerase-1